ncbi:PREDICTED: equilibrative nucleoside transporter 1 isoform X2 [Vollenhovia emeryi]|nr:PREDICTED: equilibrative nucleoside transporter 1 isoform X2 [Vollenhovia emeryi]XP_011865033.1 PREDICTED: equilibrative nucleoside transporter 1 isoform X2 [Vollenhovia emeryi]XP_011865034.1 PREDICTED: equilibrative nucleoside transporter 1 isoform X2 [Vollenhovia emeryi]
MSYSINRRPLLGGASDSEFEDDLETEVDDPSVTSPDEKPFFKPHDPHDKYNLAYVVFYLLGINTLIPWSFFITADDYWMYKFREIHGNSTTNLTHTYAELLEEKTDLQASFTSYLSVASALPNTLFLIINAFISKRVSLTVRMVGSQLTILLLFILTTVFVEMDTDKWQNTFLIITLTTVALVNAASAIFGGSLMGIVGKFSPKYITAMSGGQALGGIFTALAEICSLWIGASPMLSGLVYFIIGDTMLLLSLVAYVLLERAPFFKHHMIEKEVPDCSESDYSINGEVSFSANPKVAYTRIIKRIWHYGVSIFLVFFISLAVYPAVTVLVESEHKGKGHAWNDIYFVPVVTYLIFSTGDYVGRLLCGIFQWPRSKPWLVMFMSVARGIFIPVFMFCNAQPRHHLPVYIHGDIYYILITIIFAVTNGYLCNLTFILAPTVVDSQEREVASAMMGAFLGIGLASGAALSLYMVKAL